MSMNDHIITSPQLDRDMIRFWFVVERMNGAHIIYPNNILSVAEKSAYAAYCYETIARGAIDQPGTHTQYYVEFEMCRQDIFRALTWQHVLQDFEDVQMNLGYLHMMCLVRNISTQGPRSVVIARLQSTMQNVGSLFMHERLYPRPLPNHFVHNDVYIQHPNQPNPTPPNQPNPTPPNQHWPQASNVAMRLPAAPTTPAQRGMAQTGHVQVQQQQQQQQAVRLPLRPIQNVQQAQGQRLPARPAQPPPMTHHGSGPATQRPPAPAAPIQDENAPPPAQRRSGPPPANTPMMPPNAAMGGTQMIHPGFQQVQSDSGSPMFVRYQRPDRRVVQIVRPDPTASPRPSMDTPPASPQTAQVQGPSPTQDAAWPNGANDVRLRRPPSASGGNRQIQVTSYAHLSERQIRGSLDHIQRYYPHPYQPPTTGTNRRTRMPPTRRNMAAAAQPSPREPHHDASNYTSPRPNRALTPPAEPEGARAVNPNSEEQPMDLSGQLSGTSSMEAQPPTPREPDSTSRPNQDEDEIDANSGVETVVDSEDEEQTRPSGGDSPQR